MEFPEIENKRKSFAMTTALFTLLFLLFFYLKFSNEIKLPDLDGGGGGGEVAVNFGDSDVGSGDNFQSVEKVVSSPKQTQPVASTEKEIVVSENNDAPAVVNVAKPIEKPKKVEIEKPVVKVVPKPSKSTADALSNLLNGSNKGGDGDDKTAGNKGKANGSLSSNGYYGTGGSGGGTGGGNGTGNRIGTGSGYGAGSGGGSGGGTGYSLGNRKAISKPAPKYTCNESGKVVVEVSVDRNGKTIDAIAGIKGTTNTAKCLLDQATIAAMNTKWDASSDAPEKQVGKIVYNFNLN